MPGQLLALAAAVFLVAVSHPAAAGNAGAAPAPRVPSIRNPATPRDGHRLLRSQELWRRGGEDDDLIFGFLIDAVADEAGRVYLLDRWQSTVFVLSAEGEFLRQLSREGEGPGETRQPTDLTWLPGGELGIVQPTPGRLVRIDRQGNPQGDLVPASVSAPAAQFGILTEAAWRGGTFACCGSRLALRPEGTSQEWFLFTCDLETGEQGSRLLTGRTENDGRSPLREADQHWVHEGRWCLGPDGRIYAAPRRDAYSIDVHAPDGRLERVIEREYEPWHRSHEERDRRRAHLTPPANEFGAGREIHVAADEPCLDELHVAPGGELWVRHSRSHRQQPPGVFQTWDVFAPDGAYARTVAIAIPGDPASDRLFFLDDGRLLLIRGYRDASRAMWSAGAPAGEAQPIEVVCYRMGPETLR